MAFAPACGRGSDAVDLSLMKPKPRLLEKIVLAVENATRLDPIANIGQKLTGRLGPGPVKDALSGTVFGHPLHPAMVAVPIGSFVGAAVLDLTGAPATASRRLLGFGLLSALPTALTGLSDWGDTQGAERRVGVAHALANWAGLGLLAVSWVSRGRGRDGRGSGLVGLSVLGLGGWLGGHLAYAQGVGVDTTAFQQPVTEWTDACAADDLIEGQLQVHKVGDTPVLIARVNGAIRAISDRCTHRGAPLHEGTLEHGCVECPWHGSRFDLIDGSITRGPATRPQPSFQTRTLAGRVQVKRVEARALRLNPAT